MQSFHTGQRAFSIDLVRRILQAKEKDYFSNHKGGQDFVSDLKKDDRGKNTAYAGILDRHFHILWRVIHLSPEQTLNSAINSHGPLTRMAFQDQGRQILLMSLTGEKGALEEPIARVMFNFFGLRETAGKTAFHRKQAGNSCRNFFYFFR